VQRVLESLQAEVKLATDHLKQLIMECGTDVPTPDRQAPRQTANHRNSGAGMNAAANSREQYRTPLPALHPLCNLGWNFIATTQAPVLCA